MFKGYNNPLKIEAMCQMSLLTLYSTIFSGHVRVYYDQTIYWLYTYKLNTKCKTDVCL